MKKAVFLFLYLLSGVIHAQDTLRLSLLFTGDIMQHDSQIAAALIPETGRYNYHPCFEFIKPVLSAPDLTIGNLELTFGGPPFKGYPQFSAPDELAATLKEGGFDVLVTANNHCVDRGRYGLERTIDMLDSAGILHTGTFKDTLDWLNNNPLILEAKGFRLSLLNYTYGTNEIAVDPVNRVSRIDTSVIKRDLKLAAGKQVDAIIVFMHWGQEYQPSPNGWQKSIAGFCLRHGAKMVIGSHPHVLQPMEWNIEKDQLVAYSLGNFVSGQRDRYRNGGALLHVDLEKIIRQDQPVTARIRDVAYSLEWVYRTTDVHRTYRILPVSQFENDTTFLRGQQTARELLIQFRDDARALLGKENQNVREKVSALKKE